MLVEQETGHVCTSILDFFLLKIALPAVLTVMEHMSNKMCGVRVVQQIINNLSLIVVYRFRMVEIRHNRM